MPLGLLQDHMGSDSLFCGLAVCVQLLKHRLSISSAMFSAKQGQWTRASLYRGEGGAGKSRGDQ